MREVKVVVKPYRNGELLRMRWSYGGKRESLYTKPEEVDKALSVADIIEHDIRTQVYDYTLVRYKVLLNKQIVPHIEKTAGQDAFIPPPSVYLEIFLILDQYLKWKGMVEGNHMYSNITHDIIQKWGCFTEFESQMLFDNNPKLTAAFNARRNRLKEFFDWSRTQ